MMTASLLQSRPITTLRAHDARTGEWNSSLAGDYLWTNSNFGEAVAAALALHPPRLAAGGRKSKRLGDRE